MTKVYICSKCFTEYTFKYADSDLCSSCRKPERDKIQVKLLPLREQELLKNQQFSINHVKKK